jgi:CDP-glucose 4,6-dehydratase
LAKWQGTMEGMEVNPDFWRGKRVFLTGYTGFKGGWLSLWLQSMGAEVHGYALNPPTETNLFTVAEVGKSMASSVIADIRDVNQFSQAMKMAKPEIVFHLAAQPLVRYSYAQPAETYEVNVMGTVNLLEAIRGTSGVKAVVNVTTDKCYENREWLWGYRENEAMGGFDPYSSSKGCAELVTAAYRRSFLEPAGIALASARAGNVIGGGDWAVDRLIPDILRAMDAGETLQIRSPLATRPWQHVLEPLSGYLMLAEQLYSCGTGFAEAWNFGPPDEDARPVRWIVERMAEMCKSVKWQCDEAPQPHEANYLKLDSSKAHNRLNWQSRWHLQIALKKTLAWHEAWRNAEDMRTVTLSQIAGYQSENRQN